MKKRNPFFTIGLLIVLIAVFAEMFIPLSGSIKLISLVIGAAFLNVGYRQMKKAGEWTGHAYISYVGLNMLRHDSGEGQ